MPRFPIDYEVELIKNDSEAASVHSAHRPVIHTGPPPEFGGNETLWSPEHLFTSAIASCMTATFVAMAKRASLHIGSIRCRASAQLGRSNGGGGGGGGEGKGEPRFLEANLAFTIRTLEDDVARARQVFDEAKAHCFVANSIACPVHTTLDISGS